MVWYGVYELVLVAVHMENETSPMYSLSARE